jgi:hypothetical protein
MLVDETWSNGWQRQWHPSSDLHRPLGYTLRCTMSGSSCEAAPLGVDTSAVVFVATAGEQHATFWLAQDFGCILRRCVCFFLQIRSVTSIRLIGGCMWVAIRSGLWIRLG